MLSLINNGNMECELFCIIYYLIIWFIIKNPNDYRILTNIWTNYATEFLSCIMDV